MKPDFKPVADWIDKTYGVTTKNIIYDSFDISDKGRQLRLRICFEFKKEELIFKEKAFGLDKNKQQAIAQQFKNLLEIQEDVWVVFSAFEPIARIEANEHIPENNIQVLKHSLNCSELWEISRGFEGATFFLYTDDQVQKYEQSGTRQEWSIQYLELLKQYDEFNYFNRNNFSITLDSKENFDKNYQSNWFYYYK